MKRLIQNKKGFISIFAIFFSAIVVSVLTALYILLIKQIEISNLEGSSFQALFTADSAFECAVYNLQNSSSTRSIFLPDNYGSFSYCGIPGDSSWSQVPTQSGSGSTARSKSTLNVSLNTSQGDFCAVVTTDEQLGATSGFTLPPEPNFMSISGQSRNCNDSPTKVVERLIEFYY
jgi:hypothetical protein